MNHITALNDNLSFQEDEAFALKQDKEDPLSSYRNLFFLPKDSEGKPLYYFAGNSLGLEPKGAKEALLKELEIWAEMGVEGHHKGENPWFSYHEPLCAPMGEIVGAKPMEVVLMNSLTVNLHLMLVSFYRPTPKRHKILILEKTFPSDRYALESHIAYHGFNPKTSLFEVQSENGSSLIPMDSIEALIKKEGEKIALVFFEGVHYLTGQCFDIKTITQMAHEKGCVVGWDLAHAAGNVLLQLHDWEVDFAVWCTYKYLNSGPGSVGGCFVHEKHAHNVSLLRLAGWWGHDPKTRMEMPASFSPQAGAWGWQISNAPIFSMAACKASLKLFQEAGMHALRKKSERLTGYLAYLLERIPGNRFAILTPAKPSERGCQLSLGVQNKPREILQALRAHGVVCDLREPNVIRVAPAPFYNTFHEVWRFAANLKKILQEV